MGQNTDALMDTCSRLALALEPLAKKIAGEIKQTEQRAETLKLKKAVPRAGEKLLRKSDAAKWLEELKELKSDRNVLAKDLGSLQNSALRNATKAAKDLESKIKKKDFLNFFKTQQSLDNAKKALKQSQQAIDKAEERLTAFNKSYILIDDSCDKMTDHLKKSLKEGLEEDGRQLRRGRNTVDPLVQEWTDKFERYLTKTNPNGRALLESFQAVADKKAEVFKKLSSQIGKTKTWTDDIRKPMMKQIQDEISILQKVNRDMPEVVKNAQWPYWEGTDNLPRTILSSPAIRKLVKQTETAESSVALFGTTLLGKLETLDVNFQNLNNDLAAAGNDLSASSVKQALLNFEALDDILQSPVIASVGQFMIDEGKIHLRFLLDLAKDPGPVTREDWKKLKGIETEYGLSGKLNTEHQIRTMDNGFLNAESMAHRYKKNAEIQKAYKDYKTVYKTKKKTAETWAKLQEEIYKRSSKLVEKTLSSK